MDKKSSMQVGSNNIAIIQEVNIDHSSVYLNIKTDAITNVKNGLWFICSILSRKY